MRYKVKTGMLAWIFHRISGIALAFYLPLHIYATSSLQDPEQFDKVMAFLNLPIFKLAEIALLGAVIYHSLNGIRILIIDWFGGTRAHAKWFWGLMALGAVLFIAGSYGFISHALAH